MATIKSFTSLEQSKVLAKILPIESADMHYSRDFDGSWFFDLAEYTSVKIPKYVSNVEEHLLPCWSLSALLSVLPNNIKRYTKSLYWFDDAWHCEYVDEDGEGYIGETANSPVDACYKTILILNEYNLI